jgi:AraC-like DNA-binding protein
MLDNLIGMSAFLLAEVPCGRDGRGFGAPELTERHSLVFVRRGAFVRQADGISTLLDSSVAYLSAPGAEQRFAHPVSGGDDCVMLCLSPALLATLCGGDPRVALASVPADAASELTVRRALAAQRAGDPAGSLEEQVVRLAAGLLARRLPGRVASGRPARAAHQQLAVRAREILLAEPGTGLIELSRLTGCSPHHLSRVFSRVTGSTVSAYRNRIRVSRTLDRIAAGETDLAALAHDLGFADHAHMTRTVRAVTGQTPSACRTLLA